MAPRDDRDERLAAFRKRAERARALAERFPEAQEALSFYADVATLQSKGADALFPELVRLVTESGPDVLKRRAAEVDPERVRARYLSGEDRRSPDSFFARVLLQAEGSCKGSHPSPQLAVLRPADDGTVMSLACSLCFEEWPFPRAKCPACSADHEGVIGRLSAREIPHVEIRTCDACRRYLHLVRLDVEPGAIPDVDEVAAIALDVEARRRGYEKIQPNLVGL